MLLLKRRKNIPNLGTRQHLRFVLSRNNFFVQPAVDLSNQVLLGLLLNCGFGKVVGGATQVRQGERIVEEGTKVLGQHGILWFAPISEENWIELAAILLSQPIERDRVLHGGRLVARDTLGFGLVPRSWDGVIDVAAGHAKFRAERFLTIDSVNIA